MTHKASRMLTSPKKTALTHVRSTHVDVFVEHYDLLRRWALQFTDGDHERAEDLLHDAFIQFTLSKPDIDAVKNLDGYLFVVMRNLHLSQIRRATRSALRPVSLVEYDTVEVTFWSSDPRDRIRHWDELGAICQYACIRKESSKAGSVLILRFFHGYYPEEIAQVLRTNRSAVEKRLQMARGEARLYVEGSDRLSFMSAKDVPEPTKFIANPISGDLRLELRKQIFASRRGECMSHADLKQLYAADAVDGLEQAAAAHFVACEACLDSVNTLLDLPLLASRYPLDTIGKDPGQKGGGGGTGGEPPGGGSNMFNSYERRADTHFHHQPQELHIAVNGQLHGFQKVVGGKGEMTLMLDSTEPVGFVEVFSEQGMRLLMLHVEPPPAGEGRQSAHIELSSGRTVDAQLSFSGVLPALQIAYNDPELTKAAEADISIAPAFSAAERSELLTTEVTETVASGPNWLRGLLVGWLQPVPMTVAIAVLLVAIGGYWFISHEPPVQVASARAVMTQARNNEYALLASADKVVHRNYEVEEWSNGDLKSRSRVDEWQKKDVAAKRTYDEQGTMVAGAWTREDGSQQLFTQGAKVKTLRKDQRIENADPIRDNEPTATAFANLTDLYGVTDRVRIAQTPTQYTFNFEDTKNETAQPNMPSRLLVASLTLDRNALLATAETLKVQVGDETREYRFSAVRVEQRQASDVSPAIFEIEAELARGATRVTKPVELTEVDSPVAAPASNANTTTSAVATLDTEVEVMKALDQINALSGEQISVTRTSAGQLKVVGIVDTAQRKSEVLNAIAPLRSQPGVVIDVQTAAEVTAKEKQTGGGQTGEITLDSATVSNRQQLAVEPELRAYLAHRGGAPERIDEEVRNIASAVSNRAEALSRNALSLKSLAERFSPAEIDRLDPAKRDEWRRLIRSKAAAVAGDVRSLQSQLASVLGQGNVGAGEAGDVGDAADVQRSSQQLFGLAAACERQVNQSFAVTRGGAGTAAVKSVQFWRNLAQMAAIAAQIQKY